jgi:hypothetical protein
MAAVSNFSPIINFNLIDLLLKRSQKSQAPEIFLPQMPTQDKPSDEGLTLISETCRRHESFYEASFADYFLKILKLSEI